MSDKIKKRREELGLTLQDVGEYIGVSKATVQRYESGEIKNLKLAIIERLTQVLKINPSYLMGWESEDDEEIRAIARNMKNLSHDKRKLLNDLIKTMSDSADEELKK